MSLSLLSYYCFSNKRTHMQPGSISIQLLDREIEVLNRINHAHLIKLIEVFETQKVSVLNVFML